MVNKTDWKYGIWKKGKYIDLWSLNHLLSGALLARISLFIGVSFWLGFSTAFMLMLAWEIYEVIRHIEESIENKILDMVLGIFGFLITYYIQTMMGFTSSTVFFVIILIVWLVLNLWGYISFLKRTKKKLY